MTYSNRPLIISLCNFFNIGINLYLIILMFKKFRDEYIGAGKKIFMVILFSLSFAGSIAGLFNW